MGQGSDNRGTETGSGYQDRGRSRDRQKREEGSQFREGDQVMLGRKSRETSRSQERDSGYKSWNFEGKSYFVSFQNVNEETWKKPY